MSYLVNIGVTQKQIKLALHYKVANENRFHSGKMKQKN